MLPPFIIEEIRRRENETQRRHEQPRVEIPVPPMPHRTPRQERDEDADRGVVIIDL